MDIYTKKGDDGTTGFFYGGRIAKDHIAPEAYGCVDEAVSALGVVRSQAEGDLAVEVLSLQRALFVVGAELATGIANRSKLEPGVNLVTKGMVQDLESRIDVVVAETGLPAEFVVPGESSIAASLDFARTVVRRAERRAVTWQSQADLGHSDVVAYLNRLSDYLYMLARAAEDQWRSTRTKEDE